MMFPRAMGSPVAKSYALVIVPLNRTVPLTRIGCPIATSIEMDRRNAYAVIVRLLAVVMTT
jgi:hypothetical protein